MENVKSMVVAVKRFPQIPFWPASLYLAVGDPFGTEPIRVIRKIANSDKSISSFYRKNFKLMAPCCNWLEDDGTDNVHWRGTSLSDDRKIIWPNY